MVEKSSFDKKNLKVIDIEKRDYLEELAIPPEVISFGKKYKLQLQVVGVVAILAILGWSGVSYYIENRHEKSTALLATAMKLPTPEERVPQLETVLKEYGGTDAGLWARIEQANDAAAKKDYDQAITGYKAILDKLSSKSTVRPFLIHSLGTAYEDSGKLDLAEAEYTKLAAYQNFGAEGYLALARLDELKGDNAKAIEHYTKAQDDKTVPPSTTEWAKYKISMLSPKSAGKTEVQGSGPAATGAEKKN